MRWGYYLSIEAIFYCEIIATFIEDLYRYKLFICNNPVNYPITKEKINKGPLCFDKTS